MSLRGSLKIGSLIGRYVWIGAGMKEPPNKFLLRVSFDFSSSCDDKDIRVSKKIFIIKFDLVVYIGDLGVRKIL